jgi:hypothetical protein
MTNLLLEGLQVSEQQTELFLASILESDPLRNMRSE